VTCVYDRPALAHTLAVAIQLVDGFTGVPIRERYDVRLTGMEWWTPYFAETDATYRFFVTNRALPAPVPATVPVTIAPIDPAATHDDHGGLVATIPPAGPAPVPLTVARFLVVHPMWPNRGFRPPPGETFVRGTVRRAGIPVPGQLVRLATIAPTPAVPAARTDNDGAFAYRLPGLRVQAATPAAVVTTAQLQASVTDGAGIAQTITAPPSPATVPIGRTTVLTLDLA
jgi:hypothetical protein